MMNKNCLKQWLLENRIFGGLNNFLHQHRSVVYSVRTSCESSKHTGVKVQEFWVECSVIFFQMSNHFSFISAHHNCIWIIKVKVETYPFGETIFSVVRSETPRATEKETKSSGENWKGNWKQNKSEKNASFSSNDTILPNVHVSQA